MQLTNTQLGRTVCYTVTCVLVILMIAPIYDLVSLDKYKVSSLESPACAVDPSYPRHRSDLADCSQWQQTLARGVCKHVT